MSHSFFHPFFLNFADQLCAPRFDFLYIQVHKRMHAWRDHLFNVMASQVQDRSDVDATWTLDETVMWGLMYSSIKGQRMRSTDQLGWETEIPLTSLLKQRMLEHMRLLFSAYVPSIFGLAA